MNKENKNEVVVQSNNSLAELKNSHELCGLLLKTPHYAKMGQEGIFAIAVIVLLIALEVVVFRRPL